MIKSKGRNNESREKKDRNSENWRKKERKGKYELKYEYVKRKENEKES